MNKIQIISHDAGAPWHKESFDEFINSNLPKLLAQRLQLAGYTVQIIDDYTCCIRIVVGNVEAEYTLLQPDDEGLFFVNGSPFVVVPTASDENLDTAEIKCVGEQIYDYVASHMGEAPEGLPWDEMLVRAWLPLDAWVQQVVTSGIEHNADVWATGQMLDTTNGVSELTHLRRIIIKDIDRVIAPGQFGRVCPFEVPEGPNIGHVFSIALGGRIRDRKLEITDDRQEMALGLSASMVPFLEHNDANRQTFGVNMMRQWIVNEGAEPSLVQTGNEPDAQNIWCGKNLLTAFISHGAETYEDGILVSESCAIKLGAEVGDKLSNRHGTKGVISRVLPDNEMPCLSDGTPIDLVYSFLGVHARLNYGQVKEALAGRIAYAEREPMIVPPFFAPDDAELRKRLHKAGLPEDGMEYLLANKNGRRLDRPSTVGFVYWGRTVHTSSSKVHAFIHSEHCQRVGYMEYSELRDMGCFEIINDLSNACSNERLDASVFVKEVETSAIEPSGPPSPKFAELCQRLSAAGIQTHLVDGNLRFSLGVTSGEKLKLTHPVRHPWLSGHTMSEVGVLTIHSEYDDQEQCMLSEYDAIVNANTKLERILATGAPESLKEKALADLEVCVESYLNALITPERVRLGNRVMFSGRTVLAPAYDLRLDQLGLADDIAWTIFGPLVTRELGDRSQVEERTSTAARVLDDIMERSWVILNRAPTMMPTTLMAFHPVRISEKVIRIHPLVCYLMNADFDGDQAAVFLPMTEVAQKEAGGKLSLKGHLMRNSDLFNMRFLMHEVLWGLSELSFTPEGIQQISELTSMEFRNSDGILDRETIAAMLREAMQRDGVDAVIRIMQELADIGFQTVELSGASINPFIGSSLDLPQIPDSDDLRQWNTYTEDIDDIFQRSTDYKSHDIGPQLLAVKSGARGNVQQMHRLISAIGIVKDVYGNLAPIRHSVSEGLSPNEAFACVTGAREGLSRISNDMIQSGYGVRGAEGPKGFGVLARAMRSSEPGRVFARAASAGEIDPLKDIDSRLFVGLLPEK